MLEQILLFAPAPEGQEAAGNSSIMSIAFFVLFFLILYFFMIRPQSKKAKDQKSFLPVLVNLNSVFTFSP